MLAQQNIDYPLRRITQEDNDIKASKAAAAAAAAKEEHARMAKKARHA